MVKKGAGGDMAAGGGWKKENKEIKEKRGKRREKLRGLLHVPQKYKIVRFPCIHFPSTSTNIE